MLDLWPEHHALVRAILAAHAPGVRAWAFGSRATGSARRFSDLDIAIEGVKELDIRVIAELRHAFQESDLPMSVDLLDLRTVRQTLLRRIERERIAL